MGIGTDDPSSLLDLYGTNGRMKIFDTNSEAVIILQNNTIAPVADTTVGRLTFKGMDDA